MLKIVKEGKQMPLSNSEIHLSGQDTFERRKGYGWRGSVGSFDIVVHTMLLWRK